MAALAGATVMMPGGRLGLPPTLTAELGAVSCFRLRVVSVWQGWNLPSVS